MGALSNAMSGMLGSPSKLILVVPSSNVGCPSAQSVAKMGKMFAGKSNPPSTQGNQVFQVQYNPSSMQLTANSKSISVKSIQQGAESGAVVQQERSPSMVLRVELIFDAVNNQDAFYGDLLNVGVGTAIGVGKMFAEKQTVAPQIEGLIAAMLNNNTRKVTLYWGTIVFAGVVNEATASYSMFSRHGRPIRGNISLQLTQTIEENTTVAYWDNALSAAFDSQSGAGINEKLNGLFNVSL